MLDREQSLFSFKICKEECKTSEHARMTVSSGAMGQK